MPSDANGVYSLPPGYLAVTGETIQASQHNPPLEDLATAMSTRLLTSGANPMTGPVKFATGSAAAPSMTFSTATNVGFYKTANGIGVSINGALVFEFTSSVPAVPVGLIADWPQGTVPTGWLPCLGQSLLIASYPALYALLGGSFGSVDASHFSLPDLRGCVTAGLDPGAARGLLTGAQTNGLLIGTESRTLGTPNLPPYTPAGTVSTPTITVNNGTNLINGATGSSFGGGPVGGASNVTATSSTPIFTGTAQGGTSTPFTVVQPTVIVSKIIFTGVA